MVSWCIPGMSALCVDHYSVLTTHSVTLQTAGHQHEPHHQPHHPHRPSQRRPRFHYRQRSQEDGPGEAHVLVQGEGELLSESLGDMFFFSNQKKILNWNYTYVLIAIKTAKQNMRTVDRKQEGDVKGVTG